MCVRVHVRVHACASACACACVSACVKVGLCREILLQARRTQNESDTRASSTGFSTLGCIGNISWLVDFLLRWVDKTWSCF